MKHVKKNPLLATILLGVLLVVQQGFPAAGDSLIVTSGYGQPGSSGQTVDIILKNTTIIRGMIFNLYDTANSIEVTDVQATAGYAANFQPHFTTTPSGAVKILFMSYGTPLFKYLVTGRNSIMTVTFNVKPDAVGGSQATITIDSLVVAKTATTPESYVIKNGSFWLGNKGDVLYNGAVDLFDVLRMINIVLNRQPAATLYERWAGDLDGSGGIDILDILEALDLALLNTATADGNGGQKSAQKSAAGNVRFDLTTIPAGITGKFDLPVQMTNSTPVSGVQLSFRVPSAALELGQAEVSANHTGTVMRSRQNGDRYDLIVCSVDGQPIAMGREELLRIPVRVNGHLNQELALELLSAKAADAEGAALMAVLGSEMPLAGGVPQSFKLYPNTPNPFNMSTSIVYDVPTTANGSVHVKLAIYNTQGQLVRVLEDCERTAGQYTARWDGLNSQGKTVSSGVYFYQLQAGDIVLSSKLAVMK